ncbi:hypothetical protein [Lewinella cohaerens]|uniref:hypothetical protein n=1 Tax=Lewinella cohaerens TaxID=70995 RepID=UPI00037291B1|nr:hypothetical protein [Lewinella cohaerens]
MKNKLVLARNYLIYFVYSIKARFRVTELPNNGDSSFVVSIASYPKRDPLLPAVFEALSRQTKKPKKWILVLSAEDYPQGLPKHLVKLESLGVEILWVRNNPYAVKKLVPVIEKYPDLGVVTFDDDLIYGNRVIEKLVSASREHRDTIIGHAGKELIRKGTVLNAMFRSPHAANPKTPSIQVYFLGGSGTFYPANSLDEKVTNIDAIHRIVPGRGSDMWFWAAAVAKGTRQYCLNSNRDMSLYFAIPENSATKPLDLPGTQVMEERFQMTVDYFGIRKKLLSELPEQSKK